MNSKFTDKQIEAYASVFRDGDAIWCNGKWWEVTNSYGTLGTLVTAYADGNDRCINNGEKYSFNGSVFGFIQGSPYTENPYRVTTLNNYELQGEEKIVWLGDSIENLVYFGESYTVYYNLNNTPCVYLRGTEVVLNVETLTIDTKENWGVIPRYEHVKQFWEIKKETENYKDILQKDINSIPNAEDLLIERSELLDATRTFLQHINKDIKTNSFKGSTTIHLSTFLVSHKARAIKNIIENILKEKGYEVKSSFKVEQKEIYSSIECISTISLTISW